MKFLRLEQSRNEKTQKIFINIEHISCIEPHWCCQGYSEITLFNGYTYTGIIGDAEELTNTVEKYLEELEKNNGN